MGGGDYFYLFIYRGYYFIYLWAGVVTLFTYLFFSLFLKTSFLYIYIYYKHYKLKYFHAENLILKIIGLCYRVTSTNVLEFVVFVS